MADGTRLNAGAGGDLIDTEDIGSRGKLPRTKIVIGNMDVDSGDVSSSNPLPTRVVGFTPIGNHLQRADLSSVFPLTPPNGANLLRFQVLGQGVRLTITNTNSTVVPTSSLGFPIDVMTSPTEMSVAAGDTVNFIETAASASLEYQWGKGA